MSDREKDGAAPGIDRREALVRVGLVPLAAGLALSPARLQAAQEHVHKGAAKAAAKGKPVRAEVLHRARVGDGARPRRTW